MLMKVSGGRETFATVDGINVNDHVWSTEPRAAKRNVSSKSCISTDRKKDRYLSKDWREKAKRLDLQRRPFRHRH